MPASRIGERCVLGVAVIVQPNAVIGADGFGYVTPEKGSVEGAPWRRDASSAQKSEIVRINSIGTSRSATRQNRRRHHDRARYAGADAIGGGTKIDNLCRSATTAPSGGVPHRRQCGHIREREAGGPRRRSRAAWALPIMCRSATIRS